MSEIKSWPDAVIRLILGGISLCFIAFATGIFGGIVAYGYSLVAP
jgi:hypothetical protein